jgi:hypothetical protein
MSIKELIEHLQQFPQDATAVCVYMMCSDWHILEADQIKFYPVSSGKDKNEARYVIRNGQIMEYNEKQWDSAEKPVFLPIVTFPGN